VAKLQLAFVLAGIVPSRAGDERQRSPMCGRKDVPAWTCSGSRNIGLNAKP
jgi:hypothetical protein